MELELTEAERQELENLYLRVELLFRDLDNLRTQITELQTQILNRIKEIARERGIPQDDINPRPEFRNYRLVRMLIENSNT